MEILALKLSPGAKLYNAGHIKGVEEYLFILEGTVNVIVNNEKITLYPHDSIRFTADIPHSIENASEQKVEILIYLHSMPRAD